MVSNWVSYEEGSAVQKSVAFVQGLKAAGHDHVILMNQGAEESVPGGALAELRNPQVSFLPSYNKAPGGSAEAREIAAAFLTDFLGYPATGANTFIAFANGRNGLSQAFHFAGKGYEKHGVKPALSAPTLHWPMVKDLAQERGINDFWGYDLNRGSLLADVSDSFDIATFFDKKLLLAALYTNYPNNPLGLYGSSEELSAMQGRLDELNGLREEKGLPPIVHIADNPYFGGLPQKNEGAILQSPYEGVFEIDGQTPTIINTSLAKALGLASPGVHLMTVTDSAMAKEYETWIKARDGLSYFPEAVEAVAQMMHPDHYPLLKEHFAFLNTKYTNNFNIVAKHLGEHLLEGDPNMVCTFEVPEGAMNKTIKLQNGEEFTSSTARKFIEYTGNVYGAVAVDQSVEGRDLVRLALKAEDSAVIEEGAVAFKQAIDDFANAPRVEM